MLRYGKLAVATVLVAAALAGTASADRGIAVSETNISGTSRLIVFRSTSGIEFTLRCTTVTSRGISERTIVKVEGTRAGSITGFTATNCTSNLGIATTLALNLPWPGYYVAFLGTLPGITGLQGRSTVRFSLNFPGIGISCTYEGSVYGLAPVSRGVISSGRILTELTTLRYVAGSMLCPPTATVEGEAMATTPVTVTLI